MDDDGDIGGPEGETLSFVADGDGRRLDVWLADRAGMSRSRVQSLIDEGRVALDDARAIAKTRPQAGQSVIVTLPPPIPAEPEPEDIPLDIVYEDEDVIVLNKPAGLVVHPAPGHDRGTLVNALLFHCHDLRGIGGVMRPGIVHRLDMDTTGLIVACKNEESLASLAAQFQSGRTSKEYIALVHGDPGRMSGTIRSTIGRDPADRKRMAADPPSGKSAVTHYRVEERFARTTLLRVKIETGRTHQIRVHLSHIGLPIVGDMLYGRRSLDATIPDCPKRQMLHAAEFAFDHPRDGRRMKFSAPVPADMADVIARCRSNAAESLSAK